MATNEEMLEYLKEKFPDQTHLHENVALAKIVWERDETGNKANANNIEYEEKKIVNIQKGDNVIVKGMVADMKLFNYQGCKDEECRRKECDCGVGKKKYIIRRLVIGDEEDIISASQIAMSEGEVAKERVNVGDMVTIKGWAREYKENLEVTVNDLEVDRDEDDGLFMLDKLKKHGNMSKPMFKKLCENNNAEYEKLEDRLEEFEQGGKLFVRVKE